MKKILTNITVFLTGYLILLMVACNQNSDTVDATLPPKGDPPSVHTDCTDWQMPSTIAEPQFVGHFDVPDEYFICGRGDYDTHAYWFVSAEDVSLNIDLIVDLKVTANVLVYTVTSSFDQKTQTTVLDYVQVHAFFGSPGYLGVINAPVEHTNHGFIVTVEVFEPADYQMEIWPGL